MNTDPKAAGGKAQEWTPERIQQELGWITWDNKTWLPSLHRLAKAINASIASEREVDKICLRFKQATIETQNKTIQQLRKQLAAERERADMARFAPMALDEVEEFRKQLAAERERANNAFELSLSNAKLAKERLKQFAATQGALEAIKELSGPRSEAKRIAYAALAQLKEGK